MENQAKWDELDRLTEKILEITDITLEDDEDGNPRLPSEEQRAKLRELAREQRSVLKEIKRLES